ncbi:DUF4277 domain-containing protein [uncultured Methanospirillum sp.]
MTSEQLNDEVLGRTLDAIAVFEPTELFNHMVSDCMKRGNYSGMLRTG